MFGWKYLVRLALICFYTSTFLTKQPKLNQNNPTRHLLTFASRSVFFCRPTYRQVQKVRWEAGVVEWVRVPDLKSGGPGFNPRTCMQTHTPRGWLEKWFEKFLTLIDSMLCRLQDDVNIMGYICKWCWGPVTSSNMAHFLHFSLFPLYFSFFRRKYNVLLRKYTFQLFSM